MTDSILAWMLERGVDNDLLMVIGGFVVAVVGLMGYLVKKGHLTKDSRWFRWTARLSKLFRKAGAIRQRETSPPVSDPPSSIPKKNGRSTDHKFRPDDFDSAP